MFLFKILRVMEVMSIQYTYVLFTRFHSFP